MTVLCVNNGVTYADIAAADAAVGGTDFGVPTRYEQSGVSSSSLTFVNTDYPSSFIYTAKAGEETTGVITVGAQMTAAITIGTITNSIISNLRTNIINSSSATGHLNQNLVATGAGQDLFIFSNNVGTDDNCIAYGCSEGWRGGSTSDNHITINCTAVDTTGFGFLRPRVTDNVALNTASATYLQEGASSSNYWADDGNGTNAITETVKTDIFEDYAGGDYRIKATSSVGIAGAGAFINVSSGVTVTVTESLNSFTDSSTVNIDYNVSLLVTEVLQPFSDSSSIAVTPKVSITATVTETLNTFSDTSIVTIVETGNIAASVTEILNPFSDSSIVNVSANVALLVTEVLNSFLDGSNVTIAKSLSLTVTEQLNSFTDNSTIKLPANWVDKPVVVTSYTTQTPATTIWIDKG